MTMRPALSLAVVAGLLVSVPLPAETGLGPAAALAKSKGKVKVGARDPETVIRTIYAQYSKDAGPAEAQQQNFSPDLLKLWYDVQNAANAADEVGIDFDVFLDGQDLDAATNVKTSFTADGAGKGAVDINFTAFGKPKTVHYAMIKTAQGWKIDNISWGAGRDDLRQTLAAIKNGQKAVQ